MVCLTGVTCSSLTEAARTTITICIHLVKRESIEQRYWETKDNHHPGHSKNHKLTTAGNMTRIIQQRVWHRNRRLRHNSPLLRRNPHRIHRRSNLLLCIRRRIQANLPPRICRRPILDSLLPDIFHRHIQANHNSNYHLATRNLSPTWVPRWAWGRARNTNTLMLHNPARPFP
jgi:hypothetical protein